MPVSQSKLARLTPNMGISWISVSSLRLCGSIVANHSYLVLHGMKSGNENEHAGLDTKFWKHSPFGRVTPKMYSPAPVFTRQKLYAHPPPPLQSKPSLIFMKSTPFCSYCNRRLIYWSLEHSVRPKFVCPQHATRKPYLSPHHTLATFVVLVFPYYLVLRAAFGAFSFFSRRQL